MTKAEEFFSKLTEEIPSVKPGKMFGSLCMKTPNGKSSAMFWHENIVVKLQGESMKEAMSLAEKIKKEKNTHRLLPFRPPQNRH